MKYPDKKPVNNIRYSTMLIIMSLALGMYFDQNVVETRSTYWRGICENSIVQAPINDRSYDKLVSNDGYHLTIEGEKVSVCMPS